jgi:hypothetical protein
LIFPVTIARRRFFFSHPQSKPDLQEHQRKEELSPFTKRILIVDDHPDVILTFKKGLEAQNEYSSGKIFTKHSFREKIVFTSSAIHLLQYFPPAT